LLIVPPTINKFYVTDLAPAAAWPSTWSAAACRCS
jgi:poly(3-hydroxyalkanoate) synthetase